MHINKTLEKRSIIFFFVKTEFVLQDIQDTRMSTISDLFDKVGRIVPPEKSKLEIEVRYFIDERKKSDVFSKTYSLSQTEEIAKKLITKYAGKPASVSQTINFLDDENIKQMTFINGEQQKNLLTHYKKEKIIKPVILLHNALPAYRFTANFETPIEEFSVTKATFARIRLRYTILISDLWQLDITLVKQISDFSNPAKLKTAKNTMLFPIDVKTFAEKAPWSLAELIEFELEFIGKRFSGEDLVETNNVFDFLADPSDVNESGEASPENTSNSQKNYQQMIYQVAKRIRPRDAHKFQNTDGLKQLSNQVIELDKNMFLKDVLPTITNYYITDKIDGSRAVLYITNGICHVLTKELRSFEISSGDKSTYVLDCEELQLDAKADSDKKSAAKKYYIFDVMVYKDKSIVEEPFESRMELFNEVSTLDDSFNTKPFEKLTVDFQTQLRKFKTRKTPYETDGIILTPTDADYTSMQVYKYKPVEKLSIDFVIKKCPDKLLGISPYVSKASKTLYLLFSGMRSDTFKNLGLSFVRNYEDIFPGVDTRRLPKYFPYQFQPSNFTFAYLFWDANPNLDGEIGEFVCKPCVVKEEYKAGDDLWQLHRIRDDRKVELARGNYYGNYFKVAELSWMSYKDPLVIEDLDLAAQQGYFQQHDSVLQKASRNFHSFVKAKIFEQFAKTEWVMDLASGKGQDIFRYAQYGFKNAVFLEIDNTALLELTKRKFDLRDTNTINIQMHQLDLNADHKSNISQLDDIAIPSTGVDLIICNFAFHYLIKDRKALINIAKFINYYLKPGGRFVFTTFDGKAIVKLLNENNGNWTITHGSQVKYSIKKDYTTTFLDPIGQKIDVMLPFSNDTYYSEYLVNIDYIAEEFEKLGFTLEIDESFGSYLDNYKRQNHSGYASLDDNDKKYSSLYHYYCFYKKKSATGGKKKA